MERRKFFVNIVLSRRGSRIQGYIFSLGPRQREGMVLMQSLLWPSKQEGYINKILVLGICGILFFLVPLGYGVEVLRRAAVDPQNCELPEVDWNPKTLGPYFVQGVKVLLLAALLFIVINIVAGIVGSISFLLKLAVIGAGYLLLMAVLPYLMIRVAVTSREGQGWGELFSYSALLELFQAIDTPGRIGFLAIAIGAALVSLLGMLACGLGVPFTGAYALLFLGHYVGSYLSEHRALLITAEAVPAEFYALPLEAGPEVDELDTPLVEDEQEAQSAPPSQPERPANLDGETSV